MIVTECNALSLKGDLGGQAIRACSGFEKLVPFPCQSVMKPRILLVDDDPLMHVLYRKHLEGGGYELLGAKDGTEALAIVSREAPSLIIIDIVMPGIDGLSVVRKFKKDEATKNIPVVVITSVVGAMAATKRESENSGASGFLPKPFSAGQLLDEVRRLVPIQSTQDASA